MTEKDYRSLITSLELTKEDRQLINEKIIELFSILKNNVRYFDIIDYYKVDSTADLTTYHERNVIDFAIVIDNCNLNSFPLVNQGVLNEIWNVLVFKYNIEKQSNISIDYTFNKVFVILDNFSYNIYIRYNKELDFQTDFYISQDKIRLSFVNKAQEDFKLYKNTLQLIKYYKDQEGLSLINDYMIDLFLYYGICNNFTYHTYELYLKEFIHAIEDFLKGIRIDQDDETYRALGVERSPLLKKSHMLIDIGDPKKNLTFNIGEAYLTEVRKLKKVILSTFENSGK